MPRDDCTRQPQRKFKRQKDRKDDSRNACTLPRQSLVLFCQIGLPNRVRLEIVPTVAS
jgi:hypothetical protein